MPLDRGQARRCHRSDRRLARWRRTQPAACPACGAPGLVIIDRSARPYAEWYALPCAILRSGRICSTFPWGPAGRVAPTDRDVRSDRGRNMNINGKPYRTIWLEPDGWSVEIIDQTRLPHALEIVALQDGARTPRTRSRRMQVRGAPLIGATAAYGVAWRCARTPPTRRSTDAIDAPGRAAPDGGQPALGAGGDARTPCATCRARSASAAAYAARGRASATHDVETNRRIGEHGADADRGDRRSARGRASPSTC